MNPTHSESAIFDLNLYPTRRLNCHEKPEAWASDGTGDSTCIDNEAFGVSNINNLMMFHRQNLVTDTVNGL